MSDAPAAGYDKEPARRVLEQALRLGGVTHRALARELLLSPSHLSHKLSVRYPFDRLTPAEIDAAVTFLHLGAAERDVLLRGFGHARATPSPAPPESASASAMPAPPVVAAAPEMPARPRGNLPLSLSSFVGRESERATVAALLADARLVTITGTGGAGKTRLALEVARDVAARYAAGTWIVELATATDAALVPQAIASALGLHPTTGQDLIDALIDSLAGRTLLLVLDNCEHLLDACAALTERLLLACPALTVLATSRERLNIAGEAVLGLPSLSLPPAQLSADDVAIAAVLASDAGRLFVERARAARTGLQLTPAGAAAVAEVCRRLEGIPLALELAAACAAAMPVEQIAARLRGSLLLSARGSRTAQPRQQTLRGALDWSYNLLSPEDQALFRALATFAGGWTLDAAAAITREDGEDPFFALLSLEERSLVVMEEVEGGEARYRFLTPVLEYARERLTAAGDVGRLAGLHRNWFLSFAERAAGQLNRPDQLLWLRRLDREHDNLRAALAWSLEQKDGEAALRLTCALGPYWGRRGQLTSEGRDWLRRALEAPGGTLRARASAMHWAGWLAFRQSDFQPAAELLREALAVLQETDDRHEQALAEWNVGQVAWRQGRYDEARRHLDAAIALFQATGDRTGAAEPLRVLASLANEEGKHEQARVLYEQALLLLRGAGDIASLTAVLNNLGLLALGDGQFERATAFADEALSLARESGDRRSEAYSVNALAAIAGSQGAYPAAIAHYQEAIAIFHELGMRLEITSVLASLAEITRASGAVSDCARLMGAADALREAIGAPMPPALHGFWDELAQEARAAIGDETFAASYDLGRAMTLEQTAALIQSLDVPDVRTT